MKKMYENKSREPSLWIYRYETVHVHFVSKNEKKHYSDAHEKQKNRRSKYVKRRFHKNELIYLWKCFVILLRGQREFVQLVNCYINVNDLSVDLLNSLFTYVWNLILFTPINIKAMAKEPQSAWMAIGVRMPKVQCIPFIIIEFQPKIFKLMNWLRYHTVRCALFFLFFCCYSKFSNWKITLSNRIKSTKQIR